ncbi:MAG: DUF1080 domain-containing protein [Planctomycetota bacterium]
MTKKHRMKYAVLFVFILVFTFLPKSVALGDSGGSEDGWIELFNGRDLEGWQANSHPESFSVHEGIMKVHGKDGMSHLFYVDDSGRDVSIKDFELRAVVRSEINSNSGIFFHTGRELRNGKYLNKGYEVRATAYFRPEFPVL